MKTLFHHLALAMAGLVVLATASSSALAAVTFANTPAAVSNTYSGLITLQIGGLTNTESVVIQKYLDLNTNGVIDGRDLLVQQFTLKDGTNFVIGGVTNFNVPGDLNATTGAITAQLNFQNGDFIQNLVGRYLFKLSSPAGHFAPLTNQFAVTNFPFAQKFTGSVVSNSTSTKLSNAIVLLFPPPRPGNNGPGQPLGGTVANNAGAYTIAAPPGTYSLLAFNSNYVSNYKQAPLLTLSNGMTITTNLTLTIATASISGKLVDAANNAIGLPGVFMPVSSTNGLVGLNFTDTNGNFTARVTTGGWKLGGSDSGLIIHGYVGWNNSLNTNSGATGVTLAYPKANAVIYGSVKDMLGNPLVYNDVYANDSTSNRYAMDAYTDANGNFAVGVLGLGGSDPWYVQANGNSTLTNYAFSQLNQATNLNAGQAAKVNFTALLATNFITGNVKNNKGTNLAGVGVSASVTFGATNYQTYVDTGTNGNYVLNVANGAWGVSVNCNGGSDSLSQLGSYICPNGTNITILNNNATNNFVVQLCGGVYIITPSPLPAGEVNAYYDQFVSAASCSSSYTWTNTSGSRALPPGLSFGNNGELSGTPSTNGVFTFNAKVTDGSHATTNQQFSVTITNQPPLTVVTAALPNASVGVPYSVQLAANGGQPPYAWSLASGTLPQSLTLTPDGQLYGALYSVGTLNFTIQVMDNNASIATQVVALVAGPAQPLLSVPGVVAGRNFHMTLNGVAGQYYSIEYSTNLVNWTRLFTTNPPAGTTVQLNFPLTNGTSFYRCYESGIGVGPLVFGFGGLQAATGAAVNPNDGSVTIPVTAASQPTNQICLNYTTVDGTAISGIDYAPQSGTVCFAPGNSSNTIVIPVYLDPTNFNATFYVQLNSPNGSNVLILPVAIQNPRPVLAVYPTALTILVPGNYGPAITISNAGPQGSVLNYALEDNGALGGYLNFNGQGPVSPATGSLAAGQSTQVTITVLDQFATNWIGGTLTTAPSIYTPGAANFVKYPLSVTITPYVNLTVNPVSDNDFDEMEVAAYSDSSTFDQYDSSYIGVIPSPDVPLFNGSASSIYGSANSSVSLSTSINSNSITIIASGAAAVNVPNAVASDTVGCVGVIVNTRSFTLTTATKVNIAGTVTGYSNGGNAVIAVAGIGDCTCNPNGSFTLFSGGYNGAIIYGTTNENQTISYAGVLQAGDYVIMVECECFIENAIAAGSEIGFFSAGSTVNCTLTLPP